MGLRIKTRAQCCGKIKIILHYVMKAGKSVMLCLLKGLSAINEWFV
jgi:hypothetical protein